MLLAIKMWKVITERAVPVTVVHFFQLIVAFRKIKYFASCLCVCVCVCPNYRAVLDETYCGNSALNFLD
jgi:hypothetical protein